MTVNEHSNGVKAHRAANQLSVKGLYAGYRGRYVVEDISLDVAPGEVVGLVGHNGSGKSTVLLGIAGLISHSCNSLTIGESELRDSSVHDRVRRGIGMLLQRGAVFPELTIDTNLRLAGFKEKVCLVLQESPDLFDHVERILKRQKIPAGALSGGERRVLGLLMVLSGKPRFLLADEPTLGLAQQLESGVMSALRLYATRESRGIVLVSHSLTLIQKVCDRTYILKDGRIYAKALAEEMRKDLEMLAQLLQN
jgi:ABC-type branched-subunit amino acid transport system ATPase component